VPISHRIVCFFQRARRQVQLDVLALFRLELVALPSADLRAAFENVDSLRPDRRDQIVQIVGRIHIARKKVVDLVVGQVALLLTGVDQFLNILFVFIVYRQADGSPA